MRIALASTNRAKLAAAQAVAERVFGRAEIQAVTVAIDMPSQPIGDEQTQAGAIARARRGRIRRGRPGYRVGRRSARHARRLGALQLGRDCRSSRHAWRRRGRYPAAAARRGRARAGGRRAWSGYRRAGTDGRDTPGTRRVRRIDQRLPRSAADFRGRPDLCLGALASSRVLQSQHVTPLKPASVSTDCADREPRTVKNRVHLDLHISDKPAESEHRTGLCARKIQTFDAGETWTVMPGPEGTASTPSPPRTVEVRRSVDRP